MHLPTRVQNFYNNATNKQFAAINPKLHVVYSPISITVIERIFGVAFNVVHLHICEDTSTIANESNTLCSKTSQVQGV